MIYAFSFLKSLQFFGAVTVPFYLQRMGFTYTQMFLMELLFSVALFLFEVPTGVVADKFGRKTSLFLGSVLFGASFVIIGITRSLTLFILNQILSSFGMSLISGADRALIYENAKYKGKTDTEAAAIAGRYDAFATAAMLIAFPAGSWFVSCGIQPYTTALGTVFIATGICIMLSGIAILFVKEARQKSEQNQTVTSAFKHGVEGVKYVFSNNKLRQYSLNYAIVSGLTFLMFWFYQPLLADNNVSITWNGVIAALFNAGGMLLLFATRNSHFNNWNKARSPHHLAHTRNTSNVLLSFSSRTHCPYYSPQYSSSPCSACSAHH